METLYSNKQVNLLTHSLQTRCEDYLWCQFQMLNGICLHKSIGNCIVNPFFFSLDKSVHTHRMFIECEGTSEQGWRERGRKGAELSIFIHKLSCSQQTHVLHCRHCGTRSIPTITRMVCLFIDWLYQISRFFFECFFWPFVMVFVDGGKFDWRTQWRHVFHVSYKLFWKRIQNQSETIICMNFNLSIWIELLLLSEVKTFPELSSSQKREDANTQNFVCKMSN